MKATGRADSPYLFVMVSKPSEGMEAWFWRQLHKCGITKSEVRVVYLLDEAPAGAGNRPLKAQVRASRERFERDIKRSSPKVVAPMGTDPFFALTGINEGIFDARGYLIRKHLFKPMPTEVWKQVGTYKNNSKATGAKKGDPKMKWVKEDAPPLLDGFDGVVIPLFTLDHIRTEQFNVAPAFTEDLKRMYRAVHGELVEIGKGFKYIADVEKLPNPKKLGSLIAVDIETHGIDNEVIDLVSFSDGKTTAVLEWDADVLSYMEKLFQLPDRLYAFHNSPFDVPRLIANGVTSLEAVLETRVFDTMFAAVNVQPDLHKALGRVASLYLDIEPWKTSARKETSHWRMMVHADPKVYAGKDSFNTHWLAKQLIVVMKDLGAWDYFMGQGNHPGPGVMATLPVLSEMSRGGLKIDREYAKVWCARLERRLFRYLKMWTRMFPKTRFSQNKALQRLLYKTWGLPVQRSKEDGVTVDELALVKLRAYVRDNREDTIMPGRWQSDKRAVPRTFDLMLKIRETSKLLSTYVQPTMLSEETYVHPSYLPASKDDERGGKKMDNKGTTATGRLASFKPNIQNQPKDCPYGCKGRCSHFRVRNLYVPDKPSMCFVQADYKSAELYVLAGMSGDQRLLDDLRGDMHQRNADRFNISRKVSKNVTYASQYLAGPPKQSEMILKQEHLFVSPEECLTISEAIWGYYTDATAYKELLVELCQEKGYITNPFGRTRFFHSGRAPAAVDFIPQSTVADILWCVLKPVADLARSLGGRLVTTVHDSILIIVPYKKRVKAAREMKKIMEKRFDNIRKGFYIPVEIEMGEAGASWGTVQKWEDAA